MLPSWRSLATSGGFLFDTNALHAAKPLGMAGRTTVQLEFHAHGKVPAMRNFTQPCPSFKDKANRPVWPHGAPHYPLYPQELPPPTTATSRPTSAAIISGNHELDGFRSSVQRGYEATADMPIADEPDALTAAQTHRNLLSDPSLARRSCLLPPRRVAAHGYRWNATDCVWQTARRACGASAAWHDELEPYVGERLLCVPIEPLHPTETRAKAKSAANWTMYKPSVVRALGPSDKRRRVYIDLGARDYPSSIGNWFRRKYPQGGTFEVIAFEAETKYDASYAGHAGRDVELIHAAAWVHNGTVGWGTKWVEDKAKRVGHTRRWHRPAVDMADFLRRRVVEDDYVVLKMDIESGEYQLIPYLIASRVTYLIDELFVEVHAERTSNYRRCHSPSIPSAFVHLLHVQISCTCIAHALHAQVHTERASCCRPPNDKGRHWADAQRLLVALRQDGVYAHEFDCD